MDRALPSSDITEIAKDAYIFSFPMLMGYRYRVRDLPRTSSALIPRSAQ